MRALVIGGTRNLGPQIVGELLHEGHDVIVLNRGQTADELPREVERLRADRSDAAQLRAALEGRTFDFVADTTLYNGRDAETLIEILIGRVGRYIFISTGQVYLVRVGINRPFAEEDYEGPLLAEPERDGPDHADWVYGIEKRQAEDALADAHARRGFPYVSLRLPMVNSERDHYGRIYNYYLRLKDGGPIVAPEDARLPLRHIYGGDVVRAITKALNSSDAAGRAYNVSQDETVTLEDFLTLLGELIGAEPRVVHVPRAVLEAKGLLPHCSPFSGRWMSELTNIRGKRELGLKYTPLRAYLKKLVEYYETHAPPGFTGYARRGEELKLAGEF